jgi:hypothetical protein
MDYHHQKIFFFGRLKSAGLLFKEIYLKKSSVPLSSSSATLRNSNDSLQRQQFPSKESLIL